MKRAKRILAMVLAVMMIAGMAPTQAWDVHAEETTDQSTEISSGCGKRGEHHTGSAGAPYYTAHAEPPALPAGRVNGSKAVPAGNEENCPYK